MNKHIIMVCSQMPPIYGGAGGQAALLGRTLATMGWRVTSITLDQAGVGHGTDRGVRFLRLLRGLQPSNRWTRAITTVALGLGSSLGILIFRPSIVHIHGAYWWSIPPAVVGRLTGAKVVVKLTRDGEDDARTVYEKTLGRLRVGSVYGLSLSLAHAVIVLNERSLQIAVSQGLGSRVHLIPNGVDEDELGRSTVRRARSRAGCNLSEEDRVVLFVGYIVKHKGVLDLLAAWRLLNNRDARLWLVGPTDGFYRELDDETPSAIESVKKEGFKVASLGHLPAGELPSLYWAADVFVLPSYAEGMPNSLAEALVAGCHVVATRIPGIVEIMGDKCPDLVDPGDVDSLAVRLARAIESPQRPADELSQRLRITHTAETYENLYRDLLRSARR